LLIELTQPDILGVTKDTSQEDIRKAFLILAKKFHPDVNKTKEATSRFADINEAYETLGDANRRMMYNMTGLSANEQDNINEQFNTTGFDFDPFERIKK